MSNSTVLLATVGSSGDIRPMMAIGSALQRRGHAAKIVANAHFAPVAAAEGLAFEALGDEAAYERLLADANLWDPRRAFNVLVDHVVTPNVRAFYDLIARHDPARTLVVATGMLFGAAVAHEKLAVPYATVHLQPVGFRSLVEPAVLGGFAIPGWWPRWLRRLYFGVLDTLLVDREIGKAVNPVRRDLGLPPAAGFMGERFHAPQLTLGLFPPWYAPPQPDWPPQTRLTGFVDGPEPRGDLSADLLTFLEAGEPPLVFTAGTSMQHGRDFFASAVAASARLGRRAVLATQYREQLPEALPENVCHVVYAPFRRLLPRAAAVVHHGGIGTVAAALSAGVPQLTMPLSHDQPDNAHRLERLGVGATLLPRQFSAARAAEVLGDLLADPAVRGRAAALAPRVDYAAALEETCEALEQLLPRL